MGSEQRRDGLVLIKATPIEEVLDAEDIPDVKSGDAIIVNDDPEKPFRMICTVHDWAVAMETVQRVSDAESDR